jgi:hypothetical protein
LTFLYPGRLTVPVMRIEVLTVSGCPHRPLALTRLRDALDVAELDTIVVERVVDDPVEAAAVGMAGSPTILVEGRDLFGADPLEPSISCRLYRSARGVEGAPTVDALVDALTHGRAGS